MIRAIEREKPALCFFLGDGERDLSAVQKRFPSLPVHAVRGNCDLRSALPLQLRCAVAGVKVFAAHGHRYNVKYDPALRDLRYAALEADADVVLFGHTHLAFRDHSLGMEILNPGTIGRVARPSYGLLRVEEGRAETEIKYLE